MIEKSLAFSVPVSQVMTRSVITVRLDDSVDHVARLFLERNISGAPVVDGDGHPVGVVSKTDLLRAEHERDTVKVVEHVMTPLNFSLPESAPLSQAAALMAYEGFHRLTIVDATGAMVGVVSSLDILRWMARFDGFLIPDATQTRRSAS